MLRRFPLALLCATLLCLATPLAAQTEPAATEQEEVPEANYSLKKVALQLYGGVFSGATFLQLPPLEERTFLAEGENNVFKYDGTLFNLDPNLYSAPEKTIESGPILGGQIQFYASEDFHFDLQLAVASSKAVTTFLYDDPRTLEEDPVRTEPGSEGYDEDPSFKSLMGGIGLGYEARVLQVSGLVPYIGCSFGGVINRFSQLEDKTALYFNISGGFYRQFGQSLRLSTLFSATMFSFAREELTYGKQVTYGTAAIGLSYMIDMLPH